MGGIKPKKTFWRVWAKMAVKNIFLVIINVTVMIFTATAIIAVFIYFKTPFDPLKQNEIAQTSIIYDRIGENILYEIYGEENRKIISHDQISDYVRLATIAYEDDNFYSHRGVDLKSTLRALKADVESSDARQGGSTITQQLARNVYLTREKTLKRKIMEVILSLKIEKEYTKDEILDMYLNEIPYGANAYGIESAALTYFEKSAKDLTLDEAALLSILPNAPTYYSPYGNHADELIEKQQYVLDRMAEIEFADSSAIETAKKTITLAKISPRKDSIISPHFVFYVMEKLEERFGRGVLERGGFKIYTTLDLDMQKLAEKSITKGVERNKNYEAQNAALTAIDPRSGQILAMVGSRDYFDPGIDGQVNVATRPRQPGSSFKPFAYSKAFEKGYQPENLIIDAPTDFGPDGSGKNYIPKNYDGKFHGAVTLRQALVMSLNIPAVKTLYLAGVNETIELAHRLGITTLNKKNYYGLSLVLGGGEVTLLDETAGYSVFANDGKRNSVTPFIKIEDNEGKIVLNSAPENLRVLDSQIARKINSILSDNSARTPVFGPNSKLFIPGRSVAAKTGTAQEYRDAWTIGYTPSLAAGVWVGNNDYSPMRAGAAGTFVAAPIWYDFMSEALKNYSDEKFIAYEKEQISQKRNYKINYYDKETGERLSEKEKNKVDQKKVEMRIEIENEPLGLSIEAKNTTDPMIRRWQSFLKEAHIEKTPKS